jgi:hypothetical protein
MGVQISDIVPRKEIELSELKGKVVWVIIQRFVQGEDFIA